MTLSIIIPVYNEERTVGKVLQALRSVKIPDTKKEIIVVDDCSSDGTVKEVKRMIRQGQNIRLLRHKTNGGKGKAVRTGIAAATGDYIVIQDADMEYSPADIQKLFRPILQNETQVVYGTRLRRLPDFTRDERTLKFFIHYAGNKLLSLIMSLLFGQWLTDIETGYKIFPRLAANSFALQSDGFEIEVEITARLCRKGYHITEIPVRTTPRGYDEGKKLQTIPDGFKALKAIIGYKFFW